ncbi:General stress protein 17M [compost metagenome]
MNLHLNMHTELELKVSLVADEVQAIREIEALRMEGYTLDEIYVLAYDPKKTNELTHVTDANQVTLSDEGVTTALANLFRSKEGRLRSRMEALGLPKEEAKRYEEALDEGGFLIIARPKSLDQTPPHEEVPVDLPFHSTGSTGMR